MRGAWCVVRGAWCVVRGAWCVVRGAWCVVRDKQSSVMTYRDWLQTVPSCFTEDPLWKVEAYRLAMFAVDLAWPDVCKLATDRRTRELAGRLHRSAGSISADIAEGYSRASHKDQARFYEYALGSARESRNWYYDGRHVLSEKVVEHRLQLLTQIVRLLLTMIPNERRMALREEVVPYGDGGDAWMRQSAPFAN
jgi:four helix bundle protein